MPDDRDSRHRTATSLGLKSRQAARVGTSDGRPAVELDPELTPPPMEAPRPEELDALEPGQKLDRMAGALASLAESVAHIWPARHAATEVERLVARIELIERGIAQWAQAMAVLQATLADPIRPQLAHHTAAIHGLEQSMRKVEAGVELLDRVQFRDLRTEVKALADKLNEVSTTNRLLVKALEDTSKRQDKAEKRAEEQLPALAERVGELETSEEVERQLTAQQKAVRVGGVAAGGVGLGELVRWIYSLFHH